MNTEVLTQAANQARGLAIDAIHKAGIGHLGLPLGCAEIGAALFGEALSFNPSAPRWINRDRFVLSAGHGSMFLYAWLHLSGYDLSMEDIRQFRQLHSKTPGHPEFRETDGVEATTGPLGQGVGNAVGMATSLKIAEETYNTAEHEIINSRVVCLAGDGCLQEGVAMEASAFAGHNKLDNLILIYDSNDVTLDAQAEETQSEDTAARYEAIGFEVATIDGHDIQKFLSTFGQLRASKNGKPKLLIVKTVVGKGIQEVEGTWKAHGEGGAKFAESARKSLGLPEESFFVSDTVRSAFKERKSALEAAYAEWQKTFQAWQGANPELAKQLEEAEVDQRPDAETVLSWIPEFEKGKKMATRAAAGEVLQPVAAQLPRMNTGSADLFGSTKNYIKDAGEFTPENLTGRNIRYGIREHAMGAITNGFAYDGLWIASGATFLTFSDYMRPSVRLAALSKLPVFHFFTHDSVGVGEDGPTHQPVETTSALRLIPDLDVIRPADGEETAAAVALAISRTDGPTALILSRQNLPDLSVTSAADRRNGTLKGGYVLRAEKAELKGIVIATGSELHVALEAAEKLGDGYRVVSLPCFEIFDRQPQDYRESVLPSSCSRRVGIEAGVSGLWFRYVGSAGKVVGIDRFGLSAPGDLVLKHLGMHADQVIETMQAI